MSDKKKFIKAISSGYAYMIVSMILSLWMVPFVLKYLTRPEYGIFAIAGDLLGWFTIANLGITAAFNSKGAQLLGKKDTFELNILASTTFFTQLVTAVLIIIGGVVIILNPNLIFGDYEKTENIEFVVAILVSGFFISYITQPLNSILVADKQIHIDNYLKFGLLIIQTIITIALLVNGFKLLSLAISSFISNVIITALTWYRVSKSLPEIKLKINYWRKDRMYFLLKHGIWFTIGGIAGILIFRMDSFLIGKYVSLAVVASFVINNRLYQIADKFHGQFFNIMRPYFAQTYGRKEMSKLLEMYNFTFYLSFVSAFLLGIFVFLISKWFITWWVGPSYYMGDSINILLCTNFIVQAAVLPNRIILSTTLYKNSWHSLTRIFEGITKLTISIIFFNYYGIEGLLIGGIIASLIFSNFFLNYLSSRLFNETFFVKLVPLLLVIILPVILKVPNPAIKYLLLIINTTIMIGLTIPKIINKNQFIQSKYVKFFCKNN